VARFLENQQIIVKQPETDTEKSEATTEQNTTIKEIPAQIDQTQNEQPPIEIRPVNQPSSSNLEQFNF
jgi:hypothetical protein